MAEEKRIAAETVNVEETAQEQLMSVQQEESLMTEDLTPEQKATNADIAAMSYQKEEAPAKLTIKGVKKPIKPEYTPDMVKDAAIEANTAGFMEKIRLLISSDAYLATVGTVAGIMSGNSGMINQLKKIDYGQAFSDLVEDYSFLVNDKTSYYEFEAQKFEEMSADQQCLASMFNGVVDGISMTQIPEMQKAIQESGNNAVYTVANVATSLSASIVPALATGGGFLPFAVANTLQSGVGMYEEMKGRKRVMLNDLNTKIEASEALGIEVSQEEMGKVLNLSPATYGFIAAGASTVANAISYGLGEVMVNKIVNKYVTGELTKTIGTMAANTAENIMDFGIETGTREYALYKAGQEGVGMNMWGLAAAIPMALVGGYARGRAQYKMETDAYDAALNKHIYLFGKDERPSDFLLKNAPLKEHSEFASKAQKVFLGSETKVKDKNVVESEIESLKTFIDDSVAHLKTKLDDPKIKKAEIRRIKGDIMEAQSKIEVMRMSDRVEMADADIELARQIRKDMEAHDAKIKANPDADHNNKTVIEQLDENGEIQYLHGGLGLVDPLGISSWAKEFWYKRKVDKNVTDQEIEALTFKAISTIRETLEDAHHIADHDFEAIMNSIGDPDAGVKKIYTKVAKLQNRKAQADVNASLKMLVADKLRKGKPDADPKELEKELRSLIGGKKTYSSAVSFYSANFPRNADDVQLARYSDDFVDALNLPDPLIKAEMKKVLKDQGWIAMDDLETINKVGNKLKENIEATVRFETVADVYHNLKSISEEAGMDVMKPFIEVTGGKTKLSEAEMKTYWNKYMNMEENLRDSFFKTAYEYSEFDRLANSNLVGETMTTLNQKLSRSAMAAIDPRYRQLAENMYDNLRTWGKGSGHARHKFQRFMVGDTDNAGLIPFLQDHGIDKNMDNIVKYLDEIDKQQAFGTLKIENGTLMDIHTIDYPKSVAQQFGLSDAEVVAAHKIANHHAELYKIYNENRASKIPYDLMGKIQELKSFGEMSADFKGDTYFPRIINEAKAKEIKSSGRFSEDTIIRSTFTKNRGMDSSLAGTTEGRLPHLQEMELLYGRMVNKMFYDPLSDNFMEMGTRILGVKKMREYNINNLQDLETRVSEHVNNFPGNKQAKYFHQLLEHYNNIFKKQKEPELIERVFRRILKPSMNAFTATVLSPWRASYQVANLLQVYNNMSMYTGYKNMLKTIPSGIKSVMEFVTKNQWSVPKRIQDIDAKIKSGNLTDEAREALEVRKTYFTRFFDPGQETGHWSFQDGMDMGVNTTGISQNPMIWEFGGKRMNKTAIQGANYIKRMLTTANTVSDLASREWGLQASLMRFKDFEKRFQNRSLNSIEDLSKNIAEAKKFLGLDGIDIVPQRKLDKMLLKWFEGNDMKSLRDEYIYQMIDSGLYHYDVANRHGITDAASNHSIIFQGMTRFTSWPMYDLALHGRIYRDARNGNYAPLIRTLGALAAGIGINAWLNEYTSRNNNAAKFVKKVALQRAKGVSLYQTVESKYKYPKGMLSIFEDAYWLVAGTRERIKLKNKYANLFAVPDSDDAKDLARGGKRTIRDLNNFITDVREWLTDAGMDEDLKQFNNVLKPFEAEGLLNND